jgi:excisionase family DNA binding protein
VREHLLALAIPVRSEQFTHKEKIPMTRIKITSRKASQPVERLALSKREAAVSLGVCERTLNNWVKQGKIIARKTGNRVLFPVKSLQEFLNGADSTSDAGSY